MPGNTDLSQVQDEDMSHVCWVFVLAVRRFLLSSPLWWYVIHTANDPMFSDLIKKKQYPNYTTTFGNNVRTSIIFFWRTVLITGACSYGPVYFNVTKGVLVFSYGFNNVSISSNINLDVVERKKMPLSQKPKMDLDSITRAS